MSIKKPNNFSFSLLNINTLTDSKLVDLNNLTSENHITFMTETNISNKSHENVIRSDETYTWKMIDVDYNKNQRSRVAIKFPSYLEKFIKVSIIQNNLYENPERVQKDKTIIQSLFMSLQLWQYKFKTVLVYRVPDADNFLSDSEQTDKLFQSIENFKPDFVLGDFNIDYNKLQNKQKISSISSLKQIITKFTRIGPSRSGLSKTIIDHIYVKHSLVKKFKYDVKDVCFSDHKIINFSIDANVPKIHIRIKQKVDKFRRYFPKNIDWTNFPLYFDPEAYSNYDTDGY